MITQKLYGTTTLLDSITGMVSFGEIALLTDMNGGAEIHVRNSATGDVERIEADPATVDQLVTSIRAIHERVSLVTEP